jgi:hypothetical protein
MAAIALLGTFTSCSTDETLNVEKSTGTQTLTIKLNPTTRAAAYTDPGTTAENTINSVTIGIFDKTADKDGNYPVKTIQEVAGSATPSITTSQLAEGDHVLVAVNAKAGTFAGVKNLAEFEAKTLAIDDALADGKSDATAVANTKLPMFGTGDIAPKGESTTEFTADVPVYHMVAKVTLQSLYVDFDATGAYKDATFTPTEVFMYNVPDKLDFYPASSPTSYVYNYLTTKTPTYYNGEAGDASVKAYLGTGTTLTPFSPAHATISGVNGSSAYSWGTVGTKILFLYTMPNTSTKPTQIIIKGTFRPVGTDTGKETVYYPVNINYNYNAGTPTAVDGGILKQVYPNKNYVIDVTIKGKGVDDLTKSLDPEIVTAHITVNSFVDAPQSNTFN